MAAATDLKALYRQTVLAHSRDPHHFGPLAAADHSATGHNPLCGDKCTVYLRVENHGIAAISFEGAGCAISMASASIMTDMVDGLDVDAAQKAAVEVLEAFSPGRQPTDEEPLRGEMAALGGVRDFPTRIRCASLPWKTFQAALQGLPDTVTTEATG